MPAPSLPVSVTAATRGSATSAATSFESMKRLVKTPSGRPARRNRSSMASAVWGTFEACLSRPTLPTMSAGAANRITCQSGKFHGMTASTTPMRLVVHVGVRGRGRDGLVGQQALAVVGEPAQTQGALGHLGLGGGERLAHLGGQDAGHVGHLTLEELGRRDQVAGPLGVGGAFVVGVGVGGALDQRVDLRGRERGEFLLRLAGGGVDGGEGHDPNLP